MFAPLDTTRPFNVLAIETSCDETAVAVVRCEAGRLHVISNLLHTQVAEHAAWGGVVPEVASREHLAKLPSLVREAGGNLQNIHAVAATAGPGLIGALLVGVQLAKGLALARHIPWLPINHLEGHLSAACLAETPPAYPHVALLVSGGHTHLYGVARFGEYHLLGATRDDAAGEAFDKVAKLLGLGYPGGVHIERAASNGNPAAVALPMAMLQKGNFDLSFSGLKTAAAQYLAQHPEVLQPQSQAQADFCASLQEAICQVLARKAVAAAVAHKYSGIVLAGGVAANSRLREVCQRLAAQHQLWCFAPPKALCTDNAAMIGAAAIKRLLVSPQAPVAWTTTVRSRWPLDTNLYPSSTSP